MEIGTPESIQRQYAAPPHETPDARRRRLANRRAAKYRYLRSREPERVEEQREKSSARQRSRRQRLDDASRAKIREQNRQRQQLRRERLTEDARESIREAQRNRQKQKRRQLDEDALEELRQRERMRLRRRRQLEREAGGQRQAELHQLQPHQQAQQPKQVHQPLLPPQQPRLPQLRVHTGATVRRSIPGLVDGAGVQLPSVSDARSASNTSHGDKDIPALQPQPRHHQHRRHQVPARIPFGLQFSLPPPPPPPPPSASAPSALPKQATRAATAIPFTERVRPLPHLQVALPQASTLLHPAPPPVLLMPAPPPAGSLSGSVGVSNHTNGLPGPAPAPSAVTNGSLGSGNSLGLPMAQPPLAPIVLPPAHRSLPPLPDFLNSREVFDPASATSSSLFQLRSDQAGEYHNV